MKPLDTKACPVISPSAKASLAHALCHRYREGPLKTNSKIYAARELAETTIAGLGHFLKKEGSVFQLSIETDHSRYMPVSSTGGAGLVKALIIFDGAEPVLRELAIAPTLIRLAGKPTFIDHGLGAVQFMDAVIREIQQVASALDTAAQ